VSLVLWECQLAVGSQANIAKKRRLGQDWSASTKSPSSDVGRDRDGGSYLVAEANSDCQSTGTSQALQSLSMRTWFQTISTPWPIQLKSRVYLFFGQHLRVYHRFAWKWSKSITKKLRIQLQLVLQLSYTNQIVTALIMVSTK